MVYIPLKELRIRKGLSQEVLARQAGCSTAYIQRIEQGKSKGISLDMTAALAKALNCSPGDLLEWKERD